MFQGPRPGAHVRSARDVTCMFTALQVMALLHSLFCKYDALLTKFGVYKGGFPVLHSMRPRLAPTSLTRHCISCALYGLPPFPQPCMLSRLP